MRFGLGAAEGGGLLAALGAAIGSLIRSQLAGVVGALVWCLILESILGGLSSSLGRYLPFTAATSLGGSRPGGGDIGFYATDSIRSLPFAAATVLVAGIAAAIAAGAAWTSGRADIS
jgi:hypothetical protein